MTTPTGTALLAQASAEDLERDARLLDEMAGYGIFQYAPASRHSLLRAATLLRAVAIVENDESIYRALFDGSGRSGEGDDPSLPAALAAVLGGEE